MRYSFLEPIQVGPFTLRNRVIKPAMAEYICNDDGTISDQFIEFYRGIARGGAALIVPGISVSDPKDRLGKTIFKGARNPFLFDEKFIPGLKKAVDAVHAEGARIMFQCWNSGSAVTENGLVSLVSDYTKEDLDEIREGDINAARIVKAAGADGVEIHIAHTYLLSQFLSPRFNKRTDEYGCDTIENATRFAVEIMDAIREELCDDTFCMIAKLNGMDDFKENGITPEWAGQAAEIFEKAGIQLFTVNAGGALVGYNYMSDNGHQPEGWKTHIAQVVKRHVSVPVAASGNIRHVDYAHQLIKDNRCDIIAMGRTLLADPEWVKKVQEGREDELRYCLSCLYCFARIPEDGSVPGCCINPYCKCEASKPELKKDGEGRKVVVVGAGPSGLEAAVVLAERGFKPVLFEKNPYIGGLVDLASVPPHKSKLRWLIDYYQRQLRRLKVEVHLSTEATAETIKEIAPYAVVLATGTNEVVPGRIPGITEDIVVKVRDILEEKPRIQHKNIVIIGGGMTGMETAHYLALKDNKVTVVEMMPKKALAIADALSLADAMEDGAEFLYETKLCGINKASVTVEDVPTGEQKELPADMVILSMGIRPNVALKEALEEEGVNVITVGDCNALGRIPTNIRSGAEAAYRLR